MGLWLLQIFHSISVGIDFRRQNLTSISVRFWCFYMSDSHIWSRPHAESMPILTWLSAMIVNLWPKCFQGQKESIAFLRKIIDHSKMSSYNTINSPRTKLFSVHPMLCLNSNLQSIQNICTLTNLLRRIRGLFKSPLWLTFKTSSEIGHFSPEGTHSFHKPEILSPQIGQPPFISGGTSWSLVTICIVFHGIDCCNCKVDISKSEPCSIIIVSPGPASCGMSTIRAIGIRWRVWSSICTPSDTVTVSWHTFSMSATVMSVPGEDTLAPFEYL